MTYNKLSSRVLLGATVAASLLLISAPAFADTLTRQLEQGMSGSDVSALQTFLAQDNTIYPQGLVTGYFGPLTFSAVSNWQARNGIATVGRVGPITLAALNIAMSGGGNVGLAEGAGKVTNVGPLQPTLSNISVSTTANSATVTWNSSVSATAKVWYSTQWPFVYQTAANATNASYSTSQSVTIPNLQGNTTYYYVVESLDAQGNFSWSRNGATFKTQ